LVVAVGAWHPAAAACAAVMSLGVKLICRSPPHALLAESGPVAAGGLQGAPEIYHGMPGTTPGRALLCRPVAGLVINTPVMSTGGADRAWKLVSTDQWPSTALTKGLFPGLGML